MAAQQTGIYDEYLSVRSWTKWSLGVFPADVIDLIKPLDWVGAQSGVLIPCFELFWRNTSYLPNWEGRDSYFLSISIAEWST